MPGRQKEEKICSLASSIRDPPLQFPFYCTQRIRFDLRLLPRVAFAAARPQAARSRKIPG